MDDGEPLLLEDGAKTAAVTGDGSSSISAVLILSTVVIAAGSLANGCAIGFSSPAQDGIMKELDLSIAEYSLFGSISTIGGMLGAIISGKVADVIGRKRTIFLMQIFCILGWLAINFSQGAWLLDFGRLSIGFGLGLFTFVTSVYIAEITPKDIRGAFASVSQLVVSGGISLMFLLGNLIHWRILAVIGAIPCVFQIIGCFFIPESPRWLAKIGREKEVETTLRRLRGKNVDISQEAAGIRYFMENLQQLPESGFLDLFQRKYARSVIVGVGLMLLVQLGGYNGVSFYASSIFEAAGFSGSIGTTAVAIIQMPFSLIGVLLMDKIGRRALLNVTAGGTCLGSFLAGLAFLLQELELGKEFSAMLVLCGMLVYFCSYSGLAVLPWLIMSEIFPMNIKGSAGSLVTLACWISNWIVSYTFNFLFEWSRAGVFFIFAGICGSTVIFGLKLVPETKGRPLEEIQASMVQLFA